MIRAYAITDPAYYGSDVIRLKAALEHLLDTRSCDYLCFRDKTSRHYAVLAACFVLTCKAKGFTRVLLHGDMALAKRFNAFGVHLTSTQCDEIPRAKEAGLFCVISTHTEAEIIKAFTLGADAVTYSPIFATPGKGEPKGLDDLKEKTAKIPHKIIALGGIVTDHHVAEVEAAGAYGFASIRYFIDTPTILT